MVDKKLATDMVCAMRVSSHASIHEKPYRNFLRNLFFLLHQVELGRNPATLMINLMMITLIKDGAHTWNDFLPANDTERTLSPLSATPLLAHPMTFTAAPDAAVQLNTEFNALLPFHLRYVYDGRSSAHAAIIAEKQRVITVAWYTFFTKAPNLTTPEELIDPLCELASTFYAPAKK